MCTEIIVFTVSVVLTENNGVASNQGTANNIQLSGKETQIHTSGIACTIIINFKEEHSSSTIIIT